MSKGLDIGTSFIVKAEPGLNPNEIIVSEPIRDGFIELDGFTPSMKSMLDSSGVSYIEQGDQLYIVGSKSLEFANIQGKNARRPLQKGVLNPNEKEALPFLKAILGSVLGVPKVPNELIYYTIPGTAEDHKYEVSYHQDILKSIIDSFGYKAKAINEALCICLSELGEKQFTGISCSFGAGMLNVCYSFLSVPAFTFSLARSGDWLDFNVGNSVGLSMSKCCAIKERKLNLIESTEDRVLQAYQILYGRLIEYLLKSIRKVFLTTEGAPRLETQIPIVISGGTASPIGFIDLFKKELSKVEMPFEISDVILSKDMLRTVAKGALIAAISDEKSQK